MTGSERTGNVKGIILAGGLGSRLYPLTKVTNKHLLPVYDKPMIYYPIESLIKAGIDDIMIVTGGNFAGDFLRLLKNGRDFNLRDIHYTYQEGEGGIADALSLAEHFADGEPIIVVLGDNIYQHSIKAAVEAYRHQECANGNKGARVLLKPVEKEDAKRFGIAELQGDKIVGIEEKPQFPKSNLTVTGTYMYDQRVFEIIKTLRPSDRGELEITDVNNNYANRGELLYSWVDGWWTDAGTAESLFLANTLVAKHGANRS
jgi:glucose-1-phosphate thymidylyltransferase